MENNNMKVFNIDGIKVSIPMDMYKEACRVFVLEEETSEEEIRGNYICIKQMILAGFRESLDDLGKITFEYIKNNHTEKEISERVQYVTTKEIKLNGGNYDSTK